MTSLPDGGRGKVLAVAIAVLSIAAFYFVVVVPALAFYDGNALKLEERREAIARYQEAARDLPRLRSQAQALRDQSGKDDLLFSSASDAVAAADLQSTLKDLIEAGDAKLTSAQTLPVETRGNLRRVGIRVAFTGDLALLTGVLLGIESARPALSVGDLELHSTADDGGQTLSIALDVYGLRGQ